jgi:hypothetical protein
MKTADRREFLLTALSGLTLVGCGSFKESSSPTAPSATQQPQTIDVLTSVAETSALVALLPQGTTTDWQQLESAATSQFASLGWIEGDITVFEGALPSLDRARTQAWELKGSIGNYFYRLSQESGSIGGCIKKANVPHVGLLLKDKRTDREIVNLHLCSWIENGRRCFGIYNSATEFCQKVCGPTRSQMQSMLKAALVAAGIGVLVAAVIAPALILMAAPVLAL